MHLKGGPFEEGQRKLLEWVALGYPVAEVLDGIVRLIERQASDLLCSILLVDAEQGCVRHAASPSIPPEYSKRLDGAPIGPTEGSCGAAAYLGERVIVEDIAVHPNWAKWRDLALPFGLRACWSSPIYAPDRTVLGTFAIYYRETRGPTAIELEWVGVATHLASIALLRERTDAERRRMEEARHASEEERRRLEAELQQSQRLQSLGTLAAGIAHDVNNVLAVMRANAELALLDVEDSAACRARLLALQQASEQGTELVRRILTFSREHAPRREMLDLRRVIDEVLDLGKITLAENVELKRRYGVVPSVAADPVQIHQVVMNLVTNAAHALRAKGGTIEASLSRTLLAADATTLPSADLRPGGEYVCLTVRDDGCGMNDLTRRRIFDPFFTTKPQGEGTGLGLSTVHGIAKAHGGAVVVESAPEMGTTFSVFFPVAPAAGEGAVRPSGGARRVLYVDDEEALLFVARRALGRLGHIVTGCSDPLDALRIFESRPQDFDVLVTDISMPGLSGLKLAETVLAMRPAMKVILVTGLVRNEDCDAADKLAIDHVVPKPLTLDELERTIGPLLHER